MTEQRNCMPLRQGTDVEIRSLYVHVPFCPAKCPYCVFYSKPPEPGEPEAFLQALEQELRLYERESWLVRPLETIYMGGGTPSFLPVRLFEKILALGSRFLPDSGYEWTVEVNPGTLSREKVRLLREYGVNRVSVGVQAFQDRLLRFLGRIHNSREVHDTLKALEQEGSFRVSLDLMFGIPGQTLEEWRESLGEVKSREVGHVSLYSLTPEEGSELAWRVQQDRVSLPSEDDQARQYEMACERLQEYGLRPYELANFAWAGWECRHNLAYWENRPYLGCGPGAHSSTVDFRWWNQSDLRGYCNRLRAGRWPVEGSEALPLGLQQAETVFLGLRLAQGLSRQRFREAFAEDVEQLYPVTISRLTERGMLAITPDRLKLTWRGWMLANQVMAEFLP